MPMTLEHLSEADRLVEAAVAAEASGDTPLSNQLLRRCLEVAPRHPLAHYLLGADCAQRGDNGNALLHLVTAVEGAPGLLEARLQLGLLWLVTGHPQTASQVLAPITALPGDQAIGRFGVALAALAEDAIEAACEALRQGLAMPCANAALLADMRGLLQRIEAATAAAADPAMDADRQALQHGMAVSAYRRDPDVA